MWTKRLAIPLLLGSFWLAAPAPAEETPAPRTIPPEVLAPPWLPPAPPLPPPPAGAARVSSVEELLGALEAPAPGATILLAEGRYLVPRTLRIAADRVTLRGATGRREAVVLDGSRSRHGELLVIGGCRGVTIADLTIEHVRHNGIKLESDRGVREITVRNCVLHDIWQRSIKGVRVPPERRASGRPADCVIEHCLFWADRPKRYEDDPADTPASFRGNYIGGIDAMYPLRWKIRDNVFAGLRGRTGEARGAIFLWHEAEECVVERNVITDCDTGICLGNSWRPSDVPVHATRCVVRNNFVTRCPETGILADWTRDCSIVHNTIHDPESRLRRLIRVVHSADGLLLAGNLLDGPPPRIETSSEVRIEDQLCGDFTSWLRDPARGDLHLRAGAPAAIAAGARRRADAPRDIDGETRESRTAVGADEPGPAPRGEPRPGSSTVRPPPA